MLNAAGQLTNTSSANGTRTKPKICLDSTAFAALFGAEEERWKVVRDILQDAHEGRVEVVVSALVLVECETPATTSGSANGDESSADMIADFFESEFLTRCNVDPFTGELARRLRAQLSGVVPLAAHTWLWLATALLAECDYLMSYDRRLHKIVGHASLGKLSICAPSRPWDAGQLSLADVEGVMGEAPLVGTITRRTLVV